MAWKEPKVDWKDNDIPTSADFNRIEENIKENNSIVVEVGVPSGAILMWSGSISAIPAGWTLCDGNDGAPDLRNRFIVGAGSEYSIGNTGGAKEVALTKAQMPSHDHGKGSLIVDYSGSHTHAVLGTWDKRTETGHPFQVEGNYDTGAWEEGKVKLAGFHSHSITGNTSSEGSGQAHENRPPYFALAFIMKL